MATWNNLGAVSPKGLVDASRQVHYATQWAARFARAYAEPKPDDSHTSLVWRHDLQAFVTNAVLSDGTSAQLGVRPATLNLLLIIGGDIEDAIAMHKKNDSLAGEWVRTALSHRGFNLTAFDKDPPYEMPAHKIAKGSPYEANRCIAELGEITRAYDNVQPLLEYVADAYADVQPGPSEVRTWPHHFDTGLLITLEEAPTEAARAVGVGLAAPDALYEDFYFYTYPWPRHPRKNSPRFKSSGAKLQTKGFYGAVMPVSAVVKRRDQAGAVAEFFSETVAAWKDMLEAEMAAEPAAKTADASMAMGSREGHADTAPQSAQAMQLGPSESRFGARPASDGVQGAGPSFGVQNPVSQTPHGDGGHVSRETALHGAPLAPGARPGEQPRALAPAGVNDDAARRDQAVNRALESLRGRPIR